MAVSSTLRKINGLGISVPILSGRTDNGGAIRSVMSEKDHRPDPGGSRIHVGAEFV